MEQLTKSSTVTADHTHGEVHFSIGGLWEVQTMQSFLDELDTAAAPFIKAKRNIRAVGDMSAFTPQNRETGDAIRTHLVQAMDVGLLERIAIINPSPLVKLQYKRLSDGLEVEFFENKTEALAWIRR